MTKRARGRPRQYDHKRIKNAMQAIIDREDKRWPLTDTQLANLIEDRGIPCSMAILVKLRQRAGIANKFLRRENQ